MKDTILSQVVTRRPVVARSLYDLIKTHKWISMMSERERGIKPYLHRDATELRGKGDWLITGVRAALDYPVTDYDFIRAYMDVNPALPDCFQTYLREANDFMQQTKPVFDIPNAASRLITLQNVTAVRDLTLALAKIRHKDHTTWYKLFDCPQDKPDSAVVPVVDGQPSNRYAYFDNAFWHR